LERAENERDAERISLGVADELREIPGVTTAIMVALGRDGVKTVEDLAGCATDDLVGWSERKNGETVRHKGALSDLDVSRTDAEALVVAARVAVGWITAEEAEAAEPVEPDAETEST
jgi:N utilization substance protein A